MLRTRRGIVAVILGRSAQGEIAQTGQGGAGMAKAGVILGVIAIVLMIIGTLLLADRRGRLQTTRSAPA